MIEVEESEELLTLRVRPRMPKTIDEEQGPRNHHQQGWQIHLAEEEICPKNRSHPSPPLPDRGVAQGVPPGRHQPPHD